MLDILQDVPNIRRFGFGLLHRMLYSLDLFGGRFADMFVFVYPDRVFKIQTLLTNGYGTSTTKVLKQFPFVSGTDRILLAIIGSTGNVRDESVGLLLVLDLVQVDDSMAFETVHKLMSHDAVGTKVIGTIDATGDGVQLFRLTPRAADHVEARLVVRTEEERVQDAFERFGVAPRTDEFVLLQTGVAESVEAG